MTRSPADFADDYVGGLLDALIDIEEWSALAEAANRIRACTGTVWLVGNGGSAALASHMATDLQLASVRALALNDVAAVTTYGNDNDFELCFSMQLDKLARAGDVLIAVSGSGNSINVIFAAETARGMGVEVIGLCPAKSKLATHTDLLIPVPRPAGPEGMGIAQDLHQTLLHIICYWLMEVRRRAPAI